jgi:probable rRNA maturation factor
MEETEQISCLDIKGLPPGMKHLKRLVEKAATETLREHDVGPHALSITFVGDGEMTRINRASLGRRGTTDVIAFDLSEAGLAYCKVGDIYISLDRAREQAARFKVGRREEIIRLVVHGVLHVIGYRDDTPSRKRRMEARQERTVKKLLNK